jgi:putative transposase
LAIYLGLNPLIATNNGDLMGRQFFDFLKKMDERIVKRMAQVQRNGGLLSRDNKYMEYVRRLREFLKNEINRVLNRLINLYKPVKLVVEKLDFRSPELQVKSVVVVGMWIKKTRKARKSLSVSSVATK